MENGDLGISPFSGNPPKKCCYLYGYIYPYHPFNMVMIMYVDMYHFVIEDSYGKWSNRLDDL